MSRFDPIPGQPYGTCTDCGITLTTQVEAREHMSATNPGFNNGPSHSIRITNSPRGDRIQRAVNNVIDDAINDAMPDLDRLIERDGATAEEVRAALGGYPDFADAYDEWVSA